MRHLLLIMTLWSAVALGQEKVTHSENELMKPNVGLWSSRFPVVDNLGDTVVLTDYCKTVLYLNDTSEILGFSKLQIDGYAIFDCDLKDGCSFWYNEYGSKWTYEDEILITQAPFTEFEYVLGGLETGHFDRQIRMTLKERK